MGCGSGIEDLREQIRATHERFGEVHEIYTNAYEELYSHRVITRGWDDCPKPEFSYRRLPSGNSELEQAVRDKAQEIVRLGGRCQREHGAASSIARRLRGLARHTEGDSSERELASMDEYLTRPNDDRRRRHAEALNGLAGEDDDTVWETLRQQTFFTAGLDELDDEFTTYPEKARELVTRLLVEGLEAVKAREALKQRGIEENETGKRLYVEWSQERAGTDE